MATSEPRRLGVSIELKPHAYDPVTNPELFEGVLARRVVAFLIDFLILSIPVVFVSMFIFVIGVVTFGLGFLFYGLLWPAMVLWAIAYYGLTLGGRAGLFRARRGPCRGVLGHGFDADAVHPAGLPVQRAPALPARHSGRYRRHQQCLAGVGASRGAPAGMMRGAVQPFDAGGIQGDIIAR